MSFSAFMSVFFSRQNNKLCKKDILKHSKYLDLHKILKQTALKHKMAF